MSKASVIKFSGNRRPVSPNPDGATVVILPVLRVDRVEIIRIQRGELLKLDCLGRVVEGKIKNIRKDKTGFDITVET